jgi:tetratricopeptide (TPR) repeat protein
MTDPVERAVPRLRRLVAKSGTPGDREVLVVALVSLAMNQARGGRYGDALSHADEAAKFANDLVDHTPQTHLHHAQLLSCLSTALQLRFEITGELASLNHAIEACSRGLDGTEDNDRNRCAYLSNLGNLHRLRYERVLERKDVELAVLLQREAIAAAPDDEHDHSALLSNLGTCLRLSFEANNDADVLDEAVAVLRQAAVWTSPHHDAWMRRQSNLAAALRVRYSRRADPSDLAEAESILRGAIELLSDDSPDTAVVLSNLAGVLLDLANATGDDDKLVDATRVLEHVVESRQRVLGREHPDALASANNLANALARLGRLSEAAQTYAGVCAVQEQVLGREHPDTLASANNLANVLAQAGKLAEAELTYRRVLGRLWRVLGPDHPDTLASRRNLAYVLTLQSKLTQAAAAYQDVYKDQRRVLGRDHPETLETKTLLTGVRDMLGKKRGQAAVNRVIIVVDMAGGASSEAHSLLAMRERMYVALETAFTQAHVAWADCAVQDMGDGALILMPSVMPKNLLVGLMPEMLVNVLHLINASASVTDQLRLRLAMHTGEVCVDDRGVTSPAILDVFRMLDSPMLRGALNDLAVMISDPLYHNVDWNAFPGGSQTYRPIRVEVQSTANMKGWLREQQRQLPSRPTSEVPKSTSMLTVDTLVKLTDALLAMPLCRTASGRRLLLDQLAPEIAGAAVRHPRAQQDVLGIVYACANHRDGLASLLSAVSTLDRSTVPLRYLNDALAEVLPEQGGDNPEP